MWRDPEVHIIWEFQKIQGTAVLDLRKNTNLLVDGRRLGLLVLMRAFAGCGGGFCLPCP